MVKELPLDMVAATKRLATEETVIKEPRIERLSVERLLKQNEKEFSRSWDHIGPIQIQKNWTWKSRKNGTKTGI